MSNNHLWDGNENNKHPSNFRPYTFTNDPADLIILYQMHTSAIPVVEDNRDRLLNEVLQNLLATQHNDPTNFALETSFRQQEDYAQGAFRYGMFETGEWLTEGKGWFNKPTRGDYFWGGVFNGRALWALGVSLEKTKGENLKKELRLAIKKTLQFCMDDDKNPRYVFKTKHGNRQWTKRGGEHGYLTLGMLHAAQSSPNLLIEFQDSTKNRSLKELCVESLNTLVDTIRADSTWSPYANADAINILALSTGVRFYSSHPDSSLWRDYCRKSCEVVVELSKYSRYKKYERATFYEFKKWF